MTGATELTEYERQAVQRDADVSLVMLLDTVQRIKTEAAATAPDALRVRIEALATKWERYADERPAMPRWHIAQLRALLEDGAL